MPRCRSPGTGIWNEICVNLHLQTLREVIQSRKVQSRAKTKSRAGSLLCRKTAIRFSLLGPELPPADADAAPLVYSLVIRRTIPLQASGIIPAQANIQPELTTLTLDPNLECSLPAHEVVILRLSGGIASSPTPEVAGFSMDWSNAGCNALQPTAATCLSATEKTASSSSPLAE